MQRQYIHDFVSGMARDVRIIELISHTLTTLELIHLAGVTIKGEIRVLDLSCEIEELKGALRIMGVRDDEQLRSAP